MSISRILGLFSKRSNRKTSDLPQSIPPAKQRIMPLYMESSRSFAQFLYKTGSILINEGLAYANDTPAKPSVEMTKALMAEYNKLPAYQAVNNATVADNPLHALFVMRVALDHLDAHSIHSIYINLKNRYHNQPISGIKIKFPNGSDMLGEHATLEIMRVYIQSQQSRFGFLSPREYRQVVDKNDVFNTAPYSYIIGAPFGSKKAWVEARKIADGIMKMDMPAQKKGLNMSVRRG